jgi:hypothetical protein
MLHKGVGTEIELGRKRTLFCSINSALFIQ